MESGGQGCQAHVGASAELPAVADEVPQIVRVMDPLNRRFAGDGETPAAWESAGNVVAMARRAGPGRYAGSGTSAAVRGPAGRSAPRHDRGAAPSAMQMLRRRWSGPSAAVSRQPAMSQGAGPRAATGAVRPVSG